MLPYLLIYAASYFALYRNLPLLQDAAYERDILAQCLRHLVLIYLCNNLAKFIWRKKFIPKWRLKAEGHAVLITGCDTGFGNLLARKLDKAGYKVLACCLFPEAEGAKQLQADCSSKLRIVKLDVTSDGDALAAYEEVKKELEEENLQLLAVVNNAGILATGEVEFGTSLEPFERQIEVNCLGTVRVTKAFSPLLRRCKSSPRLVNVTSLAARISLPGRRLQKLLTRTFTSATLERRKQSSKTLGDTLFLIGARVCPLDKTSMLVSARRTLAAPTLVRLHLLTNNRQSFSRSPTRTGMVGYCVSKCAALSFTDGIRIELQKWNIKVISVEPHLFRTNLIAMEAQHRALRKLWDTSRQVTRDDYGEQFFEGATKLLDHGIGTARTNIPDVVDAMFDSVTLRHPEVHKKVCSSELEQLRCWFLIYVLPAKLQDFLLHRGAQFITGKPTLKL